MLARIAKGLHPDSSVTGPRNQYGSATPFACSCVSQNGADPREVAVAGRLPIGSSPAVTSAGHRAADQAEGPVGSVTSQG
jgi:hypothetical protein